MRDISSIIADIQAAAEIYQAGSGHFVYTSNMHGDGYVNYRPLGLAKEHNKLLREACVILLLQAIEAAQLDTNKKIVVVGPETMGATMIDRLREADSCGLLSNISFSSIKLLKDETSATGFTWEVDAYDILQDAQIIVMDDLLNQSSTFGKINTKIGMSGQQIAAMAVIGDRCNVTAEQLEIKAIVSLEQFPGFTVHNPEVCSQCMAKVPIVLRPGHGHNFQKEFPAHPGGFLDHP